LGILSNGLTWVFLVVALAMVVIGAVYIRRMRVLGDDFAVQRRSKLLSSAEQKFFECLVAALSDDFYIFTKVAMPDVVQPTPAATKAESKRVLAKLKGECLDYVLCKKDDLSIFGVIELESFEKSDVQRVKAAREQLINGVCKSAHLRLFYFDVRQDYQGVDIRRLVTGHSSRPEQPEANGSSQAQFSIDNSCYAAFAKQRTCPQCNGEVVTKVAAKGKRIGEKFLMCRKYPYCDYRISMDDKEVMKKIQQNDFRENESMEAPGFSDWAG